jgi:phosphoglycerol transferase MdoB-like AlkP superfamily enzyme
MRSKIPPFIIALVKLAAIHLLLFFIIRIAFVLSNLISIQGNEIQLGLIIQALIMGLRFDLTILSYILMLPFLLLSIGAFFKNEILKGISVIYLKISLSLALFISCADIPYYIQFQKHLSKDAFVWINQGTLSIKLVFSDFSYWGYLLLFIPLAYVSIKSVSRLLRKESLVSSERKYVIISFLIGGFCLFSAARGRFTIKSPIHPGLAYISDNMLVNQTGLNANFVLLNSFLSDTEDNNSFFNSNDVYKSITKTKKQLQFSDTSANNVFVRHVGKADSIRKLNVVVVLMESMCATKMDAYGQKSVAPNLTKLSKQGLYFSDFYSAGIHTYNGIFSTITGFPAILHEHALEKYIDKKFNGLPFNFKEQGYQTLFFTTHDEQFDNMAGFLKYNNIDEVFSEKDFPIKEAISTLGVPDHIMFDFVIEKLNKQQQPFFSLILTSSDHGPWEIPDNIPFKPDGADEQERAAQYADWSIGRFIERVKKEKWFDNTLFVFLGDHGVSLGHTYQMPLSFHHIPCVFYCPKFIEPQINEALGGQIDVFPTIMGMLGFAYDNHSLGIDLLKEKRPCIYFSADNKIGCIGKQYYYFDLLDAKQEFLYEYKNLSNKNEIKERQGIADSLRSYVFTMLQTANYLISKQKY